MCLTLRTNAPPRLVRELAERIGLTETGAITEAVRAKLAELNRDTTEVGTHRRHENAQQLLNELHNSLTEAERAQVKAAGGQLYDDAGLPP